MTEKEALTRIKTGNFNGGYGFDMQLLINTVGIIGEMFKKGQISEIVRCEKCIYGDDFDRPAPLPTGYLCQKGHGQHTGDWFCAEGKKEVK